MIDSRNLRDFIEKFHPNMDFIGFDSHVLKRDGIFVKSGKEHGKIHSVYMRDIGMKEHLMADVFSRGCRFFEFQCLLYEARRNGLPKVVSTDKEDFRSQEWYRNAVSLFLDPIRNIGDFKERVLLANKLAPHHSMAYEELISLDGNSTLSGKWYDGPDKVTNVDDVWQLFFVERGSESLEVEFFSEQYLFEHLLESVMHII